MRNENENEEAGHMYVRVYVLRCIAKKERVQKNCQRQSSNRRMGSGTLVNIHDGDRGNNAGNIGQVPKTKLQESTRRRNSKQRPYPPAVRPRPRCLVKTSQSHMYISFPFFPRPRPRPRFFSPSLHTHAHLRLPLPGSKDQQMINIRPHSTCVSCESLQREKPPVNWCQSRTRVHPTRSPS